jgi:arsenate reductase
MEKKKVLFVCVHNSARSQMAEAFLKQIGGRYFDAESAGIEPAMLNPLVVESMGEIGIDISRNKAKDVFDFIKAAKRYHYVVTVCDEAHAERCPIFPGVAERLHWSFADPSALTGTRKEKLARIGAIRDAIGQRVRQFVSEYSVRD